MGFFLRSKLRMLPVMDFEKVGRDLWSSMGLSNSIVDKILEDHESDVRRYLLKECHSLDEIDSYAAFEQNIISLPAAWKRVGPYLCYFVVLPGSAILGIQFAPRKYIVRTGPSSWQAYEIPEEIRELIDDQIIEEKERNL